MPDKQANPSLRIGELLSIHGSDLVRKARQFLLAQVAVGIGLDRYNYTRCVYRVGPLSLTPYTRMLHFPTEGFEPIAKIYVGAGASTTCG